MAALGDQYSASNNWNFYWAKQSARCVEFIKPER